MLQNALNNKILPHLLATVEQHAVRVAFTLVTICKTLCSMNIYEDYTWNCTIHQYIKRHENWREKKVHLWL